MSASSPTHRKRSLRLLPIVTSLGFSILLALSSFNGSQVASATDKCVATQRSGNAKVCVVKWSKSILFFELTGFKPKSSFQWTIKGFPAAYVSKGQLDGRGSTSRTGANLIIGNGAIYPEEAYARGIAIRAETRSNRSVTFAFPGHT